MLFHFVKQKQSEKLDYRTKQIMVRKSRKWGSTYKNEYTKMRWYYMYPLPKMKIYPLCEQCAGASFHTGYPTYNAANDEPVKTFVRKLL